MTVAIASSADVAALQDAVTSRLDALAAQIRDLTEALTRPAPGPEQITDVAATVANPRRTRTGAAR